MDNVALRDPHPVDWGFVEPALQFNDSIFPTFFLPSSFKDVYL